MLRPTYTMRESARHGLLDEVKRHYDRDPATIHEQDEDGETPLHVAAGK